MRCPTLTELPPPPPGKNGWPWTEESPQLPDNMPDGRPWPRVSIVTPSYNQGQFIEETIRSVLLQGYPNLEYTLIDGGSTDSSVDVIRKYEKWLTYWVSEKDRGQSHAINKGWERSTGEILAWLNSDDRYRPGIIAAAASVFHLHPNAGLVYGRAAICDENWMPTGRFSGRQFHLEDMVCGGNPVSQSSAFVRRSALDQVGQLDESLHFAMDFDLWLRLGLLMDVVFVDDVWSDFRFYPFSKSGRSRLPFDENLYRILHQVFESSKLPAKLLSKRNLVLARFLMRVAVGNYQIACNGKSRIYALRALWQDVGVLGHADLRWDFVRCLIGRRWTKHLLILRALRNGLRPTVRNQPR